MKVLVTGNKGQVARCLADQATENANLDLVFAARRDGDVFIDLADDASIRSCMQNVAPDIVLNVAAYTAVDQAEDEPELAMKINGVAPGILAEEAATAGAKIVQVSTDYVFDGELDRPYRPDDPVNPIGVYGRTKLAGELAVRKAAPEHLILRTAWVYSNYGKNFYLTMLRLAETKEEISVVDDQIGNPTSANEIAKTLLHICNNWRTGDRSTLGTTGHFVGPEAMTWCEFARRIMQESEARGGPHCRVQPIPTSAYPTRARRPKNSRLDMVGMPWEAKG